MKDFWISTSIIKIKNKKHASNSKKIFLIGPYNTDKMLLSRIYKDSYQLIRKKEYPSITIFKTFVEVVRRKLKWLPNTWEDCQVVSNKGCTT